MKTAEQNGGRVRKGGHRAHGCRVAGRVLVNAETFELIKTGGMKKGDVLNVAQVGGIMGAKRTSDIIPMCHPIMISGVDIDLSRCASERHSVEIIATTKCTGATGVEMEALTAVSALRRLRCMTCVRPCSAILK